MSPGSANDTARRLQRLVVFVAAAGTVAVASSVFDPGLRIAPSPWQLAVAVAAFCLGDVAAIHLRFGHDQHSFTLSETAVVLGLVLLPSPWARVVACACVATAHIAARRPALKVLFNAAGFATGVALARIAYDGARHFVSPGSLGNSAALALGALAFFVWNGLSVSAAVAFSQGLRIRTVYFKGLMLNSVVFMGNTALGIGLVAAAQSRPDTLLVLPFCCPLLLLCYRAYLRALQERDTWEVLQATSRDLIGLSEEAVARVVLDRAPTLFGAEFVDVLIVDGEPGTRGVSWRMHAGAGVEHLEGAPAELGRTFWPRVICERELFEVRTSTAPAAVRADLEELGLAMCIVAPLLTPDGCLGALRIGFRGAVKLPPRERQVLSTFANHVSVSLQNARLFEATNQERGKLAGILTHSSDGIFSLDDRGMVNSWNRAMAAMTGADPADVIGRPLSEALAATDEDGAVVSDQWLFERLLAEGSFQAPVAAVSKACGTRWLALSASAVPGATDGATFAVVVARDVTAIREAEEAKQDFVATVSHELRTPLTPIKGFLVTMLRPGFEVDPESAREYHGRMLSQVDRLERLIEDLLTVSKMDRGTFTIAASTFDMGEVLERLTATMARSVDVLPTIGGGAVVADPGRVEQVLCNLVDNADKYSPPGARISVSVERRGDEVVVAVTDEGAGIPEDQHEAIFERFRRLGHHLTRAPGGTGLGLFIARRLVDSMGGRIWVESTPGEGATFRFSLPAAGVTEQRAFNLVNSAA